MGVRSAPFYWIECDGDGCEARCPNEDDEAIAWVDESQARAYAEDSDWWTDGHDRWHCPDCVITEGDNDE